MTTTVSYIALLSACLSASYQAAEFIKHIKDQGKHLEGRDKNTSDLWADIQTEADLGAQHIIITSLSKQFPTVTLVGEEDEGDYKDYLADTARTKPEVKPLDLTLCDNLINKLHIQLPQALDQLDVKDLLVWVDPLDGTTEFSKGRVEAVTVLIGFSYRGYALGGIIHGPFTGVSLYGGIGLGCFGVNIDVPPSKYQQYEVLQNHPAFNVFIDDQYLTQAKAHPQPIATRSEIGAVVTSKTHLTKEAEELLKSLNLANILQVGGAGNKGVQVIIGSADALVYPRHGTKRWDICSNDALIYSMGGILTDIYGEMYRYLEYTPEAKEKYPVRDDFYNNQDGIVMTSSGVDHQRYLFSRENALL